MLKRSLLLSISLLVVFNLPVKSYAAELIGQYDAYIGEDDLYNSKGARLTQPWQIIRQDRANFYKYGIRQDGDEADPFFASAANREAAEGMIRDGSMTRDARRLLLQGDVMIHVEIYGHGDVGDYIDITEN